VELKSPKKEEHFNQTFRAGVGAVIIDWRDQVLALERRDVPGSWQLPQGGLEEGEEPFEAIKREVLEETGIRGEDLQLLSTDPRLLAYELPMAYRSRKTGRGQVQYWFLFRYKGLDEAITLGDKKEFRAWKWMSMKELLAQIAPFRRAVYQQLAQEFSHQKPTPA
jgi:putative (di)nucleoside polyphosphate hydrolase